jgi:hypothetical protein
MGEGGLRLDEGYFESAAIPAASSIFWFASFLPPFQGLISFELITQGGTRFTSLALGYYLSGFQPF